MSFHRTSIATACFAVLLTASAANAQRKDDSSRLFADGLRLYAEKNYEEAAVALSAAYRIAPEQRTLFAWAQSVRLSGKCDEARELLTQYVANGANRAQSKAAFMLMEDCTDAEPPDAVTPDPPEVPATTSDAPIDSPENDPNLTVLPKKTSKATSPWYKDWVALGLFSAGAVGLGISAYTYSDARKLEADGMESGTTYDKFLDLQARSEDRRTLAVISGAGGLVLVGAGITYVLLRDDSARRETSGLSLQVDGESAGFAFSGNF